MNTTCAVAVRVEESVWDFLRLHRGEEALRVACAIVGQCFPDASDIGVRLLEDPDEENHTWVVLTVSLRTPQTLESLTHQETRCYQELARQLPLPYHPFSFTLGAGPIQG